MVKNRKRKGQNRNRLSAKQRKTGKKITLDARASHASPATSLLTWIDQSVLQLIVTEEHVELHGMIVIEM